MSRRRPKTEAHPEMPAESGQPQKEDDAPDGVLNARQEQAVQALLNEPTITRASATAGVNERTLRRWLQTPVFRAAVLAARREAFGHAIGLTAKYAPVAVATLVKVMQDATVNASAKVTAAAVLLRFGREGIDLDDLAVRIEALERGMPPMLPAPAQQLEDDE